KFGRRGGALRVALAVSVVESEGHGVRAIWRSWRYPVEGDRPLTKLTGCQGDWSAAAGILSDRKVGDGGCRRGTRSGNRPSLAAYRGTRGQRVRPGQSNLLTNDNSLRCAGYVGSAKQDLRRDVVPGRPSQTKQVQ